MFGTEEASTVGASEGENNIVAAVLTLRRFFQLPVCLWKLVEWAGLNVWFYFGNVLFTKFVAYSIVFYIARYLLKV
jgi:hypothetical protein